MKINDRFSITQDKWGFTLIELVPSKDDHGKDILVELPSYYGKLRHVANQIVSRSTDLAGDMEELKDLLNRAEEIVLKDLEELMNK